VFGPSVPHYDDLYAWKDYRAETERLVAFLAARGKGPGASLLDVACGTGKHLESLRERFRVEGLDASGEMLEVARRRLPDVPLHRGDMTSFDLGRTFDVVTCLFSSIGYVIGDAAMRAAVSSLARHTAPGGLLLIEPWFPPERIRANEPHMLVVDRQDLKICRMNTTRLEGRTARLDFHYLVGTAKGTEHYVERHDVWCATREEIDDALRATGLEASYDEDGIARRGLHVGRRP
jgi:SAM-dependent methyltransferase